MTLKLQLSLRLLCNNTAHFPIQSVIGLFELPSVSRDIDLFELPDVTYETDVFSDLFKLPEFLPTGTGYREGFEETRRDDQTRMLQQ